MKIVERIFFVIIFTGLSLSAYYQQHTISAMKKEIAELTAMQSDQTKINKSFISDVDTISGLLNTLTQAIYRLARTKN